MIKFIADKNENIGKQICKHTGLPFSVVNKKLREKQVLISGTRVDGGTVEIGNEVVIFAKPLERKFKTIFEDENLICIVKPRGIESAGENSVESSLKEEGKFLKALHRLDRNTEGLLLLAKNKIAYESLKTEMKNGNFEKTYLAKCFTNKKFDGKFFDAFLYKNAKESFVIVRDVETNGSEPIKTYFKTIKQNGIIQTIKCVIICAKTHQIRAHLAFLGAPIVGDEKYGQTELNKKFKIKQQELYAINIKTNIKGKFSYLNDVDFSYEPKEKF